MKVPMEMTAIRPAIRPTTTAEPWPTRSRLSGTRIQHNTPAPASPIQSSNSDVRERSVQKPMATFSRARVRMSAVSSTIRTIARAAREVQEVREIERKSSAPSGGRSGAHASFLAAPALAAGALEQLFLESEGCRDVLIAIAARYELRVFVQHSLDHGQRDAKTSRHVAADAEILGMRNLTRKAGRIITAADHIRGPVHEVPARAGSLPQSVRRSCRVEVPARAPKAMAIRHRLDDPGTHDLIRGAWRPAHCR